MYHCCLGVGVGNNSRCMPKNINVHYCKICVLDLICGMFMQRGRLATICSPSLCPCQVRQVIYLESSFF
jgi:TRAP-type C4-dicarboxylate transport system permease large subunit